MGILGGNNNNYTGTGSYNDETNLAIRAKAEQQAAQFKDANVFSGKRRDDIGSATPFDKLPWGKNDGSVFWSPVDIKADRWNKIYPYSLLVIDVSKGGIPQLVASSSDGSGGAFTVDVGGENGIKTQVYRNGVDYVISHEVLEKAWRIVLPITPQQLKITDQFAINTSATMRGIVEEHNGVKFKTISASGTTGIWPQRPSSNGKISSPSSLGSIFGGTIEAAQSLASGFNTLIKTAKSFSKNHPNPSSSVTKPGEGGTSEFTTGYYQALYLGQFLERYAEAKKNPANKGWRLVFDIPKQNQSFIVTPVAFELSQSEQKPNQMMFSFQLKAWKRIDLKQETNLSDSKLPSLDANVFQKIVRTIAATRKALGNARNLVKAVRSDAQGVFNVLRQTSLAVKDAAGLVVAVGDLPKQVVQDLQSTVQESFSNIKGVFPVSGFAAAGSFDNSLANPNANKITTSSGNAGSIVDYNNKTQKINEGLSSDQVASGALGADAAARQETDPMNDVFANPETNFDLFDALTIDDLTLSLPQQLAIENELLRVQTLTIDDFRLFKQALVSLAHDIADNFGAGNQTYSNVYGLPAPKTRPIPMTVEENEILQSIFESVQAFDLLTATKQYDDLSIESALDFVGGLANESGINFEDFSSKLLAPVPFGATIEGIAARYMGDSSKWLEIVTLNKLRSPYIDETGFTYDMLSNAEGRQFNVDDTEDNLFVGQKITITSDTQPPIIRKIVNVEKIGDGNFLITVDGLDNLSVFQTSDNARMQGYLPGTVNSQNQIYIPIDAPSDPDDRTFSVVNVPDTALNKLAKIDFLLTDNFDVAINSIGDFRLASGLTNLIQALKLKIRTQKGTILKHLDYGVGLTHGISIADIEKGAIAQSLNTMVASDSRFQSISSLSISLNGSTLSVNISVKIANGSGILPISFDMRAA